VTSAAGLVISTHRRHYAVALDDGRAAFCVLRGRTRTIACGDRVEVDVSPNGQGVITDLLPRTTLCYRSDAHREKLVAANVTQILGIVAPDPPYDDELVHRWTIAAESSGCRFVLVANKTDLPGFAALEPRLAPLIALEYTVVRNSGRQHARELAPLLITSMVLTGNRNGKIDADQCAAADAAAKIGEISPAALPNRAPHDDANDALPDRRQQLDRRFAGHAGIRLGAPRRRAHRVCLRGIAPVARQVPVSQLPPRFGTGLRSAGSS
jgi:ribosome biogenesis GTPase